MKFWVLLLVCVLGILPATAGLLFLARFLGLLGVMVIETLFGTTAGYDLLDQAHPLLGWICFLSLMAVSVRLLYYRFRLA